MSDAPYQLRSGIALAMDDSGRYSPIERLEEVLFLYENGIADVWTCRSLLGMTTPPGNPDPHAPANRKERPWNPPRGRA